jgi:hypothetical protein
VHEARILAHANGKFIGRPGQDGHADALRRKCLSYCAPQSAAASHQRNLDTEVDRFCWHGIRLSEDGRSVTSLTK